MTKKKKKKNQAIETKKEIMFEIYGIVILSLSLITIASYGAIGRNLTYLSRFIMGTWDFIVPLFGIWLALYIMANRKWPSDWSPRWTGIALVLIAVLTFNHYLTFKTFDANVGIIDHTWNLLLSERNSQVPMDIGSGMVGAFSYALLQFLFDDVGTLIVLGAVVLCGFLLIADLSYVKIFSGIKNLFKTQKKKAREWLIRWIKHQYRQKESKQKRNRRKKVADSQNDSQERANPVIYDFEDLVYQADEGNGPAQQQLKLRLDRPGVPETRMKKSSKDKPQEEEPIVVKFNTHSNMENYVLPPTVLLKTARKRQGKEQEDMQDKAKAEVLKDKLKSFGVDATVGEIHRGPAITRYEIQPEKGVKVSRIVNLADDIALALAAKDIRIEAPIPGKSAVGIEIPNTEVAIVGLRDVLESSAYLNSESKLSIALGRDIYGKPIIDNLSKMPHLLVAGATGSGKSVCINAIIISLLYKARPDEVKLMMIDPKMVELNIYNGIPHLLVPVVTDPRKAAIALKKVVAEMEKRYEFFAKHGARDIERFNSLIKTKKVKDLDPLPYIVVIVDELADLMMVAPSDVEDAICRLAQMARAAGIHLIIATQRPSVDVITGVIKANIPTRIAFAVSSQADSRTILDMGGAEKLLGRGDMLYLPTGASKPTRIQGAFLTDEEVEAVVKFVKEQQEPEYQEEMIPNAPEQQKSDVDDELFPRAMELVVEAQTASVSLLQRRLRIGYTRAARLIDMLEAKGIVGPHEGSKPREVLVTSIENRNEARKEAVK
ncbi:FtsK/SpoIIIE family DNA translocase [Thermoactinomyces mirandus]|uniref:DNA translocase FtsK n=1 Tax=Thermoactinomyces mirandus TaxID=2756294 RepID=A0A7W1XUX3_9BACL|nr:DNA translocase FtsK [Thermoactinomyces mirandus]MBA4603744.1 DNA translocase FtsK [Thermoactinomyces mirandus]